MRKSTRAIVLATSIAAAAPLLIPASPASAATTKWVYIVFPGWWGNCPGARVAGVQAAVSNVWSTGGWDLGDDIVYAKVKVGVSQSLSSNLMCRKAFRPVGYQAGSTTIKPQSNTRTIFVGATGGVYYKS